MRRAIDPIPYALTVLLLGAAACPGDDAWRSAIDENNDALCERIHTCLTADQIGLYRSLDPRIGSSQRECQDNYREANANATQPCPSGQSFDFEAAEACTVAIEGSACETFNPVLLPSACHQICRTSGALEVCAPPAQPLSDRPLADGGEVQPYQVAQGLLTGGETDVFTVRIACLPEMGHVRITVTPHTPELDLALTVDLAEVTGQPVDEAGPGEAETTNWNTPASRFPLEVVVAVRSVDGTPGDFELIVEPN